MILRNSITDLRNHLQDKLDLLVICLSNAWGGLEQVSVQDSLKLAELGLKVRFLCLADSPIHEFCQQNKDLRVFPLLQKPRDFLDFGLRAELHRHLETGVNMIHSHQTTLLGSIVPWLRNKQNVGLLATRHILNNHNKRDLFHRWLYGRVDLLVVVSETIRQNILITHAIRDAQVKVVNLGLDFERFDPLKVNREAQRRKWGADAQTRVIGMVGRIDPAKGQAALIQAAAGLMKNQKPGEKLKFVMVGEETIGGDASHIEELKHMINQFRLNDLFVFAGYQTNVPEVMMAFDICVMPSRQEAFGLVAIEAMAMECPLVLSAGGSADEIVGAEEYGLLVEPDDAFDLMKKLRYLLDHPNLSEQMGKRARLHVLGNYDKNVRLLKMLKIYERVLRRRQWSI